MTSPLLAAATLNLRHPKERPPTQGPISVDRDRGPRGELRRGPSGGPGVPLCPPSPVALQPPATDTPPFKSRRHSEGDKPKGKRPCKTKHTGPRVEKEGDRRREACVKSTIHHRSLADTKPVPEDKVSGGLRCLGIFYISISFIGMTKNERCHGNKMVKRKMGGRWGKSEKDACDNKEERNEERVMFSELQ